MIKISVDVKAILRTHIKTELETIKKLLIDKTKTDDQRIKEIDQIIYRLQSLVDTNVPNEAISGFITNVSGDVHGGTIDGIAAAKEDSNRGTGTTGYPVQKQGQ